MAGTFSTGGLITGLNSNQLIEQLMQLERQPILRIQDRIEVLEQQRDAIRDLRTQLLTLRNRAQDFRLGSIFDQFNAVSSEDTVLLAEISGANPTAGSYEIEVIELASATVAVSNGVLGAAIDPGVALSSSGIFTEVTAGTFSINGVEFTVDPDTDTLNSILADITSSSAGVNATYDPATDMVTFTNQTAGDSSIILFGGSNDDSNFLSALNVTGATQGDLGDGTTTVTGTRNLGAVDPSALLQDIDFANGAVSAGTFRINGVAITVDPTTMTLSDLIEDINESDAEVTASYDSSNDTIRVVSDTLGSRTISFGSGTDTSNFLTVAGLDTATQTAGNDSQFTINGGAVLTRNTNEVSDAIGGVTFGLLSAGTSTVTVSSDEDAAVEGVQAFLEQINESVNEIQSLIIQGGILENDGSIRLIQDFMRTTIFSPISGAGGDYTSLLDVGISTGDDFDSSVLQQFQLDEDAFREALRTDRQSVQDLFTNSDETGVGDLFFEFLDDTTATSGFLNERSRANGLIDQQIEAANDRIDRIEVRLEMRELRMRAQFTRLEQLAAGFQSQSAALVGLATNFATLG